MFKNFIIGIAMVLSMAIATPAFPADVEDSHSHYLNQEEGGELSNITFITTSPDGVNMAYTQLYSGISVADYIRLNADIIKIRDYTSIRDLYLVLNSPGGSAFDGLSIADLINTAQDDWGFVVSVQASGIVASAAVPIFAVCKVRMASPGTLFMVHESALWKWPGRETMSDIISQGELMKILQTKYLGYLVANSNLSMIEWKLMEKATTWFTVDTAREIGLIERGKGLKFSPSKKEGN